MMLFSLPLCVSVRVCNAIHLKYNLLKSFSKIEKANVCVERGKLQMKAFSIPFSVAHHGLTWTA